MSYSLIIIMLLVIVLVILIGFVIYAIRWFKQNRVPDLTKIYPELAYDDEFEVPPMASKTNDTQDLASQLDNLLAKREEQKQISNPLPFVNHARKHSLEQAGEGVISSVYAPKKVCKCEPFLIAIFAHTKAQTTEADETAALFDEHFVKKAAKYLNLKVKLGDNISFVLKIADWKIENSVQSIIWQSFLSSVEYEVDVPENYTKKVAIGSVSVLVNSVPAGIIRFKLQIDKLSEHSQFAPSVATLYRKAFISYASENRDEVLKRTQMLKLAGIDFFQDILDLNPGDRWEKELYKHINDCDVFYLFWSEAAKESEWVAKEWSYALELQNTEQKPEIIPIPIEGPPVVKPPNALGHLHFNDGLLYFIQR